MTITESELKKQIKEGRLQRVYFFYGEETYLSGHYAAQIAAKAVGGDELAAFNLQKSTAGTARWKSWRMPAEALPLMAESKCVVVRDYDAAGGGAANQERLLRLVSDPPESCCAGFLAGCGGGGCKEKRQVEGLCRGSGEKGRLCGIPAKVHGGYRQAAVRRRRPAGLSFGSRTTPGCWWSSAGTNCICCSMSWTSCAPWRGRGRSPGR